MDKVNGWYNHTDSLTADDDLSSFTISGDTWTGGCEEFNDTICLANATSDQDKYCVPTMAFCELKTLTNNYYFGEFDAVLGLGFNKTSDKMNFVQLWADATDNSAKFSVHYDFEGDDSWIYFGDDQDDTTTDTMVGTWTVTSDQDQWALKVENLTYGTN